MSPGHPHSLADRVEYVRRQLRRLAAPLELDGLPVPSLTGHLYRPLTALLGAGGGPLDDGVWLGALALEMVHEASLVHDDILDQATKRRGEPTVVAQWGVPAAVLAGDRLLTASYVVAQRSGRRDFCAHFAEAVHTTVCGEMRQGRTAGQVLDGDAYRAIVEDKTGALFGCALALGAGDNTDPERRRLGVDLGVFYQRVDDLLDYLDVVDTGKPCLQDRRQRKWTWPLAFVPDLSWPNPPTHLASEVLGECVAFLQREADSLIDRSYRLGCDEAGIQALLGQWLRPTSLALETRVAQRVPRTDLATARVEAAVRSLADERSRAVNFRAHSRSFSFSAMLFPRADRRRVAAVYAYCRFTDDLVDEADARSPEDTTAALDAWLRLSADAYAGTHTGCTLVDTVMGDMRSASVPFEYVTQLVEGMRMDLAGRRYANMAELRLYTYRVASVVGRWLTELFGIHDPWVLTRAAALGHAMQLTNILRDVGEDIGNGRLYLPQSLLSYHGLGPEELGMMARGRRPVDERFRALVQELMAIAEADYAVAFEGLPFLPPSFQRPVAVAARVYMGIHESIRRNGYDSLTRRAYTTRLGKVRLAVQGLLQLRRSRRATDQRPQPGSPVTTEPWIPVAVDHEAVA